MHKKFLSFFVMLCLGTGMSVIYVAGKVETVEMSYKIRSSEKSIAEYYDSLKNLRFRLASLKSPSQLESQMLDSKLELVPVREVRILRFAKRPLLVPKPPGVAIEPPVRSGFLAVREAQAKTDDRT